MPDPQFAAIAIASLGTTSVALAGRLAFLRNQEKRKSAELSAARRIIDELTHEHWVLLSQTDNALAETLDSQVLLRRIAELVVPSLADCSMVELLDDQESMFHRIRLGSNQKFVEEKLPVSELSPEVVQAMDSLEARVFTEGPSSMRSLLDSQVTATLIVPLISPHGSRGALTFALTHSGRRYSSSDLDLAKMLAARAALAVDNARLYRKEQLAVQARDQLMAIVSHELRNPLTAMLLKTHMLLRRENSPKTVEQIEAIQSYAKRIDRIINDLQDLDHMNQGRLAVNLGTEDALQLVNEPVDMMRLLAKTKNIEISMNLPAEGRRLLADRVRISQVISNVVGNSIKFSPERGRIQVSLSCENEQARVTITDNGPGIAPESLPHVFERHWQDPKTAHLGSGLGLTVAKGIIELHGGEIGIESQVGQGTTLWFTLRYDRSKPAQA